MLIKLAAARGVGCRATMLAAVAMLAGAACGPADAPGGAQAPPAIDTIRQADLRSDLFFLASDALNGRAATSAEADITTEFIKARFERLGLTPAGRGDSYFQPFNLSYAELGDGDNSLVLRDASGAPQARRLGDDFYTLNFSATAAREGALVYAGFGIVDARIGHDDYRGESVTGKVVLVLDGEPGVADPESPFDGVVTAESSRDWRKATAAQERGAAAILFVRDIHNRADADDYAAAAQQY